jgi:hypothetical protein
VKRARLRPDVPLTLTLTLLAGCAGPNLSFQAQPLFLCAGPGTLKTTLSWKTDGQATLAPPRPEVGVVSGQGQATVAVSQTTDFVMTSTKNGKTATGTQHVTVLARAEERLQLDPRSCQGGAALFEAELPAANWPADITAAAVSLSSPQPGALRLEHGGASAAVPAGQTAAPGLEKTPLAGPWRATLTLPDCASAPDTLIVVVTIACSGSGG